MGLYGPMCILQAQFSYTTKWAPAGDKFIFDPWNASAYETIQLIEEIVKCRVVAHNLTFDWQKISQFYCAVRALDSNVKPIDDIDGMACLLYSEQSEYCLKPVAAVCTLLLCQKAVGGTALATKEIRVRTIPETVADVVTAVLNKHTKLPEIMFARRPSGSPRWQVGISEEGDAWRDVVLKFAPSNALKDVARLVLGVDNTMKIGGDVKPPEYPKEYGYAPYAVLVRDQNRRGWFDEENNPLWPMLLREHLDFWTKNEVAREYALMDIDLLVRLDDHLDRVDTDFDSELACQVASVRVSGMEIDLNRLEYQAIQSQRVVDTAEINVDSHIQVRKYIEDALDPMEAHVCAESCDKSTLKKISTAFVLDEREDCCNFPYCARCGGTGSVGPGPMPVVDRAQHVLDIRKHKKRGQLYKKLQVAKGAYPSFRVIGTKSGRMASSDGMNYQAIDGSKDIRSIFTLAEPGWVVSGFDFDSQELAVTAAVMKDQNLADVLIDGKKLHAIFAAESSGIPYDQIMKYADDKTRPESKLYAQGKLTTYSILYGASAYKVSMDLECTIEEAEKKISLFFAQFPSMSEARKQVKKSLEALHSDENGRLIVREPEQTYIDSCFGFRRSFDCEYAVMQIMIEAMNESKAVLKSYPGKVTRKEKKGEQTLAGAVVSALFGATFSLQGKVLRAALNHIIQSTSRTLTLRVQRSIWDKVQPIGIHKFRIKLMSIHDEIITTSPPEYTDDIAEAIQTEMVDLCKTIPLLTLEFVSGVGNWYNVKTTKGGVRCGYGSE